MWFALCLTFAALAASPAEPPAKADAPPIATQPAAAPAALAVVGPATLAVGDEIAVCARQAPIFQSGPYTCGGAKLAAIEHGTGPALTEAQVLAIGADAGLDPKRPFKIMSLAASDDPATAMSSGLTLEDVPGVTVLLTNHVVELSDGRLAIFLSQNTP
jgi:hypothetical protein